MKKTSDEHETVMGVAWYRPEQWQKLRQVSKDADELEETYESWLSSAEDAIRTLALAHTIAKIDVDVEKLVAWCADRGFEVDSKARSMYVAERLRDNSEG